MTRTRIQLLAEADEILRQPNLSRENSARVEQLIKLAETLTDKSELRKATMDQRAVELGRVLEMPEHRPEETREFRDYLRAGKDAFTRERWYEMRAQSTTTTAGGYLIPESFSDRVEVMMAKTDGLWDVASPFITKNGSATGYPLLSDEGVGGAIVSENSISTNNVTLVFATVSFNKCLMWRSDLILASTELVSDSNFDFATLLSNAVAVRLARAIGASFVATLISTAPTGVTVAGTTAITSDEIYSLIDSVDEAYATNGSFLLKRSTLTSLRKLKTTSGGAYVFPEERDNQGYPLLAGYRCYISPSMAGMSAGLVPISFGDHSRFVKRTVAGSLEVRTYIERFAEYSQIGYEGFLRADGALLQSSTATPVKLLTMHT